MKLQLARAQALLNQKKAKPDLVIKVLRPLVKKKNAPWPVFHYLGVAFMQKNNYKTALEFLSESVKRGADEPETDHSISICHFSLGAFDKAVDFEKKALERKDNFFNGWLHLGMIYRAQANLNEAIRCLKKANQIDPENVTVACQIADIFKAQGNPIKALELYNFVLKREPSHIAAQISKAEILKKQRKFAEAENCLYTVLKEDPRHLTARVGLAELYKYQGNYKKAIELYQRLVDEYPKSYVRNNYALCQQDLGLFDESEANYLKALKNQPQILESLSNYLMGLHYNPERTKEEIFEAHKLWDEHYAPEERPQRPVPLRKEKNKKLRIGFISGGFIRHPVGWMIVKGLENLPKSQFEIYCYSTYSARDFITHRIIKTADQWRPVADYKNEVLSEMVLEDEIDILVELSGHSGDNRLKTVALEPAPVVVKWVGGLFNTTGLESIDYLITDWHETPKGEEPYYTEKLVRMPDDYICYTPPEYAPEVKPLPAKENGTITFGCFNNPTKVNNDILDQWAVIMGRVPESRLFLKSKQYDTEALRKRIIEKMESCGIAKDRLLFEGHTRHTELLASYNQVDIALDPWPYSGGLTTCEALWMGVPVITIPGPTFAGRHSTTHLANAGYPEWIAETWEEYIEKAVSLATDTDRLAKIRADMREQVANSPVCDGKRFGAHLSIALREMWKQRVNGYEKNLPEGEWQDHIEVKALSEQEIEATAHAPGPVAEDDNLIFDPSFLDDENLNGEHIEIAEPKKEVHSDKQPEGNPQKSPPANGVSPNGAAKPAAYSQNGKNGSGPGLPDTFKIKTKDHVTICTPGDLKLLTPYVLLEQEEWFEPELAFVRDYLKSGMTVLDVGAGFGAYALPIAKQVGDQGKVFAFEPGPVARQHLEMSKLENKFTNLEVIGKAVSDASAKVNYLIAETPELNKLDENGGEEISATTIDAWWEFEGRPGVDFIKLDVNGFEFKALSGAESLLSEASPVILFAMGEGGSQVTKTIKQLNEKGYRLYEYVPGPGLLTPYDAQTGGDSYMMNLIALKESHTELFIGSGLLHNEDFEPEEPEAGLWKQILRVQPWSRDKIDEWEQQELSPQNKDYLRALDYLCAAEQVNVNTSPTGRSEKAVLLLGAAQILIQLYNSGSSSTSVAFTLIRVLHSLGKRGQAVEIMKKLIETTKLGQENMNVDLPFMLPLSEQDDTSVQTEFSKWLMVRTVEAWILLKDVTTYLSGEQELKLLGGLEGNVEVLPVINKKKELLFNSKNENYIGIDRPNKGKFIHLCFNHVYAKSLADLIEYVNLNSNQEHRLFIEQQQAISGYNADIKENNYSTFFDFRKQLQHVIDVCRKENVDAVFMHGLFFDWQMQLIREVGSEKHIGWMIWGGDLYKPIKQGKPIYNLSRYVNSILTTAEGDIRLFNETYGEREVISFSYPFPGLYDDELQMRKKNQYSKTIIVGNSGDPSNQHIEILKELSLKKDIRNYRLIFPVAYNFSPAYKVKLQYVLNELRLSDITTLHEVFIPPQEYMQLLSEAEILVTAHNRQQAFGNILISLFVGNKTFLRKHIEVNKKNIVNPGWNLLEANSLEALSYEEFKNYKELSQIKFPRAAVTRKNQKIIINSFGIDKRARQMIEACKSIMTKVS